MSIRVEITDRSGFRVETVDAPRFWLGCGEESPVRLDIPGCASRVLEVRAENDGRILTRAEPGLSFPVRCATGEIGDRFDAVLDGDVVNLGPAMVKLRYVSLEDGAEVAEELDLNVVAESAGDPGAPIGSWYRTFMEVADHLEGLTETQDMIDTALAAVLSATNSDRVHLRLEGAQAESSRGYFLARGGDATPFGVSSSLIERVRQGGRAVHVPIASADPVASQFVSIRRERISSGIALPIAALGRTLGVLYADCVREGGTLTAEDLQRVVFIGRLLASALGNRDLVSGLVRTTPGTGAREEHPSLQTLSPACAQMVERVKLYAPTDYTVLLRGQTGTGKEVMARAVHDLSRRADGPFVPVNCAAIPEQLMESMLFGHEKGAFTGATQARAGHFEEAHGGTVFLDEIGDMPIDLQAKILRVLQDRIVTRLGSSTQRQVDVRIIAATHQDLERMIDERSFREDLYFRLHELDIRLPSLNQRLEDLPMLCGKFLAEAARDLHLDRVPDLTEEALLTLRARTWRGNIRELRHLIKAAALRAQGRPIRSRHIDSVPTRARETSADASPVGTDRAAAMDPAESIAAATWKERLEQQEVSALRETYEAAKGNLTKGAELFGVPRTTYREKLLRNGVIRAD